MLYAVLFEDNDDKSAARDTHMAAHLAFLAAHAGISAAGPLFDGKAGAGGLWLVAASAPEEVETLVRADPFWPTGLRKSVRVLEWRRVFSR